MGVAQVLRRGREQGLQQVLVVLVQQRGTAPPLLVLERGGLEGLGEGFHPSVDRLPRYAEHAGDVRGGTAKVELQNGQGSPIETGVAGVGKLASEALSLPGGEVEPAHVFFPSSGVRRKQVACQIIFADLLSLDSHGRILT